MKKNLIYTAVIAFVCAALRVLQHLFIIDSQGYYACENIPEIILKHSVTAGIIIAVILAIINYFLGKKEKADASCCTGGKSAAFIAVIAAGLMAVDAGIRIGGIITTKVLDWIGIFELFAAVFFGIFALELMKETSNKASAVFGIFPPAYALARAIVMFFDSFKYANRSDIQIEMLTICTLALFLISFVAVRVKADITVGRLKAFTSLFFTVAGIFTTSEVYKFATAFEFSNDTFKQVLWVLQIVMFMLLAFIAIIRLGIVKPEIQVETDSSSQPELDIYISEIPEEKTEE